MSSSSAGHNNGTKSEALNNTPTHEDDDAVSSSQRVTPSDNRREVFERMWSIGNFLGDSVSPQPSRPAHSRPHSRSSSHADEAFKNLQTAQETWTTTDGTTLFGRAPAGSQHPPELSSPVAQLVGASSHAFGGVEPVSTLGGGVSVVSESDDVGVSSIIHDAARITDWDKVLELCESNPEAAAYAGLDGWTALHHACNRRCPRPDVVKALIEAYPEALLQEEEKSWVPLHYACRFKAPKEVVRLLLYAVPESGRIAVATRDIKGRRPLYYAVRYDAPEGVAGLLLAVDPTAVLEEDEKDESPLALIWDSWAEKLEGKSIVHSFLPGGFPEPEDTTVEDRAVLLRERLEKEPKLKKRWQQVNMLLKAAFGFPFEEDEDSKQAAAGSDERKWRIVHATAAVKCHLSLFLLACALHPKQAREIDEGDLRLPGSRSAWLTASDSTSHHQTALHLAASSNATGETAKVVIVTLLSLYRDAAQVQDGIDGSLPLHHMVGNPHKRDWADHAAILYPFYPRGVQIPDQNGKLPLHRATTAVGHEPFDGEQEHSVIIQLVKSFPQAASQRDNNGCVPFHYFAMNAEVWDDEAEAVYNSNRNAVQLRAGPTWKDSLPIHMAAASSKSRESLFQRLVQFHPRSASLVDRDGKLPFHLACENGKEWSSGTRLIYEAFPNAVQQREESERGWLPLHLAAAHKDSSSALIEKLIDLYPEAVEIADTQGRNPLHLACAAGKSWRGGLEALFDARPSTSTVADKNGFFPIHICAFSYCKREECKTKTRAVPKIEAKKEETFRRKEAKELDILFNLIRADPRTIY